MNFSAALTKLGNHSGFSGREAYHIGRIVDKARTFERQCVGDENKIHLKYAKKNEDGTRYIPEGQSPAYFEIPEEDQANHEAELEELYNETITIEKTKIPINLLNHAGLTPAQMVALEPLLDMENPANVVSMVEASNSEQSPQPTA